MHETTDKPRVALARCPDYGPAVQEAVQHAVAVHGHEDTPELREMVAQGIHEGTPPG